VALAFQCDSSHPILQQQEHSKKVHITLAFVPKNNCFLEDALHISIYVAGFAADPLGSFFPTSGA